MIVCKAVNVITRGKNEDNTESPNMDPVEGEETTLLLAASSNSLYSEQSIEESATRRQLWG